MSARLFNPADQVQGAKSGQRSEEGIFQYTQQEKIMFHFCADISYMNFLHIPPTLVDPNTKNCWLGRRDGWLWFPGEAAGDGQVFEH